MPFIHGDTGKQNDVFEPMPEEAAAQVTAEISHGNRSQKVAEAKKSLLAGALGYVGGLAFSFLSYYFATAGGRYVVATGAIIWGAIQAIKGLVVILKIQHQEGRFTAFWRTAALAACSLAALLYLGQLSVRLAGGEEMQVVDTEQIYTGAQGIKAKIPAGYTLLEETVQPETDETYAYYGFDTYNDRIGYSLGKVVDMIPEEITSVDEISDHCAQRDSAFYTGGFIAPTQRTEIGGREMLCSEGYITENPELVYAVYDMLYEGSLVTATFRYGKKDYGKRETRLRIESLLKGTRVGITARILRIDKRRHPAVFFIKGSGRQCGQDHRESVCRRREYGQQLREG